MSFATQVPGKQENLKSIRLVPEPHHNKGSEPDHSFSRWQHFAWVLAPSLFAQIYLQLDDYLARGPFPEWLGYTSYAKTMAQFDFQLGSHVALVALFVVGVGGAVAVLHQIKRLEEWESTNQN